MKTLKRNFKLLVSLTLMLAISACSSPLFRPNNLAQVEDIDVISKLAKQLLDTDFSAFDHNKKLAVTSALFIEDLGPYPEKSSSYSSISHHLQEGLITELSRRGVNVVEIRLSKSIKVQDNYEQVLTRKIQELQGSVLLDYYLTGTLSPRPTGVQANLRVIDIQSQQVLASAGGFIPVEYFGPRETIEMRDGMLYRSATK